MTSDAPLLVEVVVVSTRPITIRAVATRDRHKFTRTAARCGGRAHGPSSRGAHARRMVINSSKRCASREFGLRGYIWSEAECGLASFGPTSQFRLSSRSGMHHVASGRGGGVPTDTRTGHAIRAPRELNVHQQSIEVARRRVVIGRSLRAIANNGGDV